MKRQVKDWILFADKDFHAAEILLKDDAPLTNIVAFHCHQATEKYLKAFMIEKGIPLVKTHDLIKLNGMINERYDLGIDEGKLVVLNEAYIDSRYPGDMGLMPDGMPSDEQACEFLCYAKEAKDIILGRLGS